MPITIDYCLFAEKSIFEAGTDKLSLIGLFDAAYSGPPFLIPVLTFVCFASGDEGEYQLTVAVSASAGDSETEIFKAPTKAKIGPLGKGVFMLNMMGLPILGNQISFKILDQHTVLVEKMLPVLKPPAASVPGESQ